MAAISTIIQSSPVLSSPNMNISTPTKAPIVVQTSVPSAQRLVQQPVQQSVQQSVQQQGVDQGKQPSVQDVQKAVARANSTVANSNHSITFGYEQKLGQLIVQISDKATGRVIQQLPSKEFIQHQIYMREMVGLLLDKQV